MPQAGRFSGETISGMKRGRSKGHWSYLRVLKPVPGDCLQESREFVTCSGARPLTASIRAGLVQEVSAVAIANLTLHPDVSIVVEPGGQDEKLIVSQLDERLGLKLPLSSIDRKMQQRNWHHT